MSLVGLRTQCVKEFPVSTTRPTIMDGLERVARRLADDGVVGDLWVDGSFLTEKIDPRDVDILLHVRASFFDKGCPEQKAAIWWVINNLKGSHFCDSHVWLEYPYGHALYWDSEWERAYWIRQFGWSRELDSKGIALIKIPAGVR